MAAGGLSIGYFQQRLKFSGKHGTGQDIADLPSWELFGGQTVRQYTAASPAVVCGASLHSCTAAAQSWLVEAAGILAVFSW